MSPFRRILVPVDFGAATEPAIALALLLARAFDSHITLLHAFDLTLFSLASPFGPGMDIAPVAMLMERELKTLCEKTQARAPNVDASFRQGAPYEVVLEAAAALGSDLIVVGTRGRRGLSRVLLGSVAERIVRLAPIPVLTVHPPPEATPSAS